MGPSIIPKQSHSLSKAEPQAHRVAMTSTSPDQSLSVDEKNRQRFKSDPRQPHTVVEVSERLDRGTPASHLPPPIEVKYDTRRCQRSADDRREDG